MKPSTQAYPNLNCGADLETLRDFIRVESEYHSDLASDYTEAIEEWDDARLAELPAEQ